MIERTSPEMLRKIYNLSLKILFEVIIFIHVKQSLKKWSNVNMESLRQVEHANPFFTVNWPIEEHVD